MSSTTRPPTRPARPRPRPRPARPRKPPPPPPPRTAISAGGSVARGAVAGLIASASGQAALTGTVDPGVTIWATLGVGLLNGLGNAVRTAREAHAPGTFWRFVLDVLGGLG